MLSKQGCLQGRFTHIANTTHTKRATRAQPHPKLIKDAVFLKRPQPGQERQNPNNRACARLRNITSKKRFTVASSQAARLMDRGHYIPALLVLRRIQYPDMRTQQSGRVRPAVEPATELTLPNRDT